MKNYVLLPETRDQSLLAQYYSMADVFVICSRRENFPTTCLEAQCCGTPVVGFDTGGTKETSIISSDDFVEYGDVNGLRNKVLQRWNEDRDEMAQKAQKMYSKETMVKKYMLEYDRGNRKERILLIDVNCKGSSTGKIVYDLYTGLRSDRRHAMVCYGRGPQINEEEIYKFGIDRETRIHAALARLTGYNGYFSPLSTKKLLRKIEEFKPELIHIHETHAYFVNHEPLINYIKDKKIPLIWTFHCEYMYTGKCGYAYNCMNFQTQCGKCPAIHDYPKSLFFDKTKQMLKLKKELLSNLEFSIVTPSQWLADRVKMSFLKDKRISVIHNGIDTNIFHPVGVNELREQLVIPKEYKVALAAAPDLMSERKGGIWVLKLAEKMKGEKLFFLLVGNERDI